MGYEQFQSCKDFSDSLVEDEADFVYIRKQTGAMAGNLSVQLDKLSEAGYIAVEKGFKGKKPCTTCRVTEAEISAFSEYVAALMDYIT